MSEYPANADSVFSELRLIEQAYDASDFNRTMLLGEIFGYHGADPIGYIIEKRQQLQTTFNDIILCESIKTGVCFSD